MAQLVTVKLADGTTYTAHPSVMGAAKDDGATRGHEVVRWIYNQIKNGYSPGPLLLESENGTWTLAFLNPDNVIGVFLSDPALSEPDELLA